MLTQEQVDALERQKQDSEIDKIFVDSYELALVFFSDESTLPSDLQGLTPDLQGLTPDELRIQLNTRTFEQTNDIVSNLKPKDGFEPEQVYSWIWIRGARDINNGANSGDQTAYSEFIRNYTLTQIDFRNISKSLPEAQEISNGIARNVINDLIANRELPSIVKVGLEDASVVTNEVAQGDPAAWAGNPLLVFLGSDIFFKANLLHDSFAQGELKAIKSDFSIINSDLGDTYDLLDISQNSQSYTITIF